MNKCFFGFHTWKYKVLESRSYGYSYWYVATERTCTVCGVVKVSVRIS